MTNDSFLGRLTEVVLEEALTDTPVVLVHGPRQCGKTTLARAVGDRKGYAYFTFDDGVTLESARSDPVRFIGDLPERAVLDEVQRLPELFVTLKSAVDRRRAPGRFLLTGSSNVLLLPTLSDSLAGRMGVLRLHPLAQSEIAETESNFLDSLFHGRFEVQRHERLGEDLAERIVTGGYPAALQRKTPHRRAAWYRDYVDTLVQRDVRELGRIRSLDALPRLLQFAAAQTARLTNVSDLASPFQLSRKTIGDYLTLLERVFVVDQLAPWHSNRLSRLIKTQKLHLGDTGVACALLGLDATALYRDRDMLGQLTETFVFQELRRLASGRGEDIRFCHYRDKDKVEVDIVLERGAREVVGVEVKAGATVRSADFRGLRKLQKSVGKRFACGVVLYDGESTTTFSDGMYAVSIRELWEAGR